MLELTGHMIASVKPMPEAICSDPLELWFVSSLRFSFSAISLLPIFFGGRFADNDQHRYASIESNDAHFDELDPYFSGSMFSDYEVDTDNDINTINNGRQTNRPANHVDVYWYATSQNNLPSSTAVGSSTCVSPMSNNKCDQFRIKFSEDNLIGSSHEQLAHTVCHEIGHTFGSDDGHTASVGCWPQSTFSLDGDLSDHEVDHLRDRY